MSITLGLLYADAYSGLLWAPLAVIASTRISPVLGIPSSVLAISGVLTSTYSGLLAYLLHNEKLSKRSLWLSVGWNVFAGVCGGIGLLKLQNLSSYGKGVLSMLVLGSVGVTGSALRTITMQ